jgi:hypothetical protein
MQIGSRIHENTSIASRYLAGQLAPSELRAYERYLFDNPAAVSELEATALLKAGLASLRDTGQLASLLRASTAPRSQRRTLARTAIAAAAVIVIAVGTWRSIGVSRDATLVARASQLLDSAGQPLGSGDSYALLRTRASAYEAVIQLPREPRAIELRVRPEAPAALYSVALSRIQPDGSVMQIDNVSQLSAEAAGIVRLYVDSSRLDAGPYLLVITPAEHRIAASTTAFRVKVVTPKER